MEIPSDYEQMVILARHGESTFNAEFGGPESKVQGSGLHVPLSVKGEQQPVAFGWALGRTLMAHELELTASFSSDAVRATDSQVLSLNASGLAIPQAYKDQRLREICKGELEDVYAKDAYPPEVKDTQHNWHFRHGSIERGGETPYVAGGRWLEWFVETTEALPDTLSPIIVFGHNVVTSSGLWRLFNPQVDPVTLTSRDDAKRYRTGNGTALVVVKQRSKWSLLSGCLEPTEEERQRAGITDNA